MPRIRKDAMLEKTIAEIISGAAREIAAAVRSDMAEQVRRIAEGAKRAGAAPRGRAKGKQKRTFPATCIYPGCNRPHGGPRSGFFCDQHVKISKAEKEKIKAARKRNGVVARGKRNGAPARNGAKKARKRRGGISPATLSQVMKVIQDSPGLRSEQIQKKVAIAPKVVKAALAVLRRDNKVKTRGERRSTTYSA
jgi:hypothetical protein